MHLCVPLLAASIICVSIANAGECTAAGGKICVLDGDTFVVGKEHIRIANIDAPELRRAKCDAEKRLAVVAKRRLEDLLADGQFEIERGDPETGRTKDRYGRTLATIRVSAGDVGDILILEDLARPWIGRRQPWCGNLSQ